MRPAHCGILGRGFYPGAKGYDGVSAHGGIMLLGRDFGTEDYFYPLCGEPPRDEWAVTWRNVRDHHLSILDGLPVWCTNYCVGVRPDGSSIGNIKRQMTAEEWSAFEPFCWHFLQAQVMIQRPRFIVVMGPYNEEDLSCVNRLGRALASGESFRFKFNGQEHTASLRTGKHRRAFTNPIVAKRGDEMLHQLRHEYLRQAF
jgi:hypothetical protein